MERCRKKLLSPTLQVQEWNKKCRDAKKKMCVILSHTRRERGLCSLSHTHTYTCVCHGIRQKANFIYGEKNKNVFRRIMVYAKMDEE